MKINFTKKEYKSLVDLLGMADWVIGAHSAGSNQGTEKYESLIQHVFSHSKEMECDDLIEHNKNVNAYCFTRKAEEESESRAYIEKFENNCFWESLVANLAARDLEGMEGFDSMDQDARFKALCDMEAKWAKECETYGLTRLRIDEAAPQ